MSKLRYIKLGTEDYPFPIKFEEYQTGKIDPETKEPVVETNVIWAASEEDSFIIPTYREESVDELYGLFLRKVVADPNLLSEMTEIITRLDPTRTKIDDKSFSYTPIGAPGNGKTFLMRAIGELVHPKGAMLINCKQLREAEEIYKKSEIGVAKSSKRKVIDAYVYMANLGTKVFSDNSLAYMQRVLGKDFISQEKREINDENGDRKIIKITSIDWQNTDASADVIEQVCDYVIQQENIPYKEEQGNIGITTTNGPLINALFDENSPDYGRVLILDEYNRLPEGESLLTIQDFFSEPGKQSLELEGADGKIYTIKRKDIPKTFLFLGTANQASEEMGESARRQSRPEISRQGQGIDIKFISEPTKADYISRTLKHLTGVPAYYSFMLSPEEFLENPAPLKEILKDQKTAGLSKEQIKELPKEEMFNIEHIDRTIKTAIAVGTLLYETDRAIQTLAKQEELPSQYTDYLKHEAVVDLRLIYKLLQHAKIEKPQGKKGTDAKNILLRRKNRNKEEQTSDDVEYELGVKQKSGYKRYMLSRGYKLEQELSERIIDLIKPKDIERKLKDATDTDQCYEVIDGAVAGLNQRAKGLKFKFAEYEKDDTIAKLYSAEEKDFPTVSIEGIKNLLVSSISEVYGKKLSASSITDDDALQRAIDLLSKEEEGRFLFVPNLDIETTTEEPIKKVVLTNYKEETEPAKTEDLIDIDRFTSSLCLKQMRKYNMKKLMQESAISTDIEELNSIFTESSYLEEKDANLIKDIVTGKNTNVFVSAVKLKNSNFNPEGDTLLEDETAVAFVVYNKQNDYTMVISDFEITEEKSKIMQANNVLYVNCKTIKDKESSEWADITSAINTYLRSGDVNTNVIANSIVACIDPDLCISCNSDEANTNELARRIIKEMCSSYLETGLKDMIKTTTLTAKDYNQQVQTRQMREREGR